MMAPGTPDRILSSPVFRRAIIRRRRAMPRMAATRPMMPMVRATRRKTAMGSRNMGSRDMRAISSPMGSKAISSRTVSRAISSRMISRVISSHTVSRATSSRAISSHTVSSLISSSRMTSRGLCSPAGISSPTSSRGINSRIRRTISRGTASRIRRKRICRRSSSTRSTPPTVSACTPRRGAAASGCSRRRAGKSRGIRLQKY